MNNPPSFPKIILNVSAGQLSIARISGGAKVNGAEYFYIPPHDALMCKTLVKAYSAHREKGGTFEEFVKTYAQGDANK